MAARAYWTGQLRVALVTVPVQLYPALDSGHRIALHRIHEPTGERIRQHAVVPEEGPVPDSEIVKGFEYEPGRFVTLTDAELEQLKLETVHAIEIVQFVDGRDIDSVYYHRPYYLAPDGAVADEAFALLREALRRTQMVGLGQVVLGGRERVVAIRPCGRGLLLEALRYEDELREADQYFRNIPDVGVDPDELALAVRLVESRSVPFDPSAFRDRYQEALRDLVAAKLEERAPEPAPEVASAGGTVIDLREALHRSLAQAGGLRREARAGANRSRSDGARQHRRPPAERRPRPRRSSA